MERGRFTLPGEAGMETVILELADKWGADAVRDSDGTKLTDEITEMGLMVYSTLCLIRMDNEWAKAHPEYRQQTYLLTKAKTAFDKEIEIDLMEHYFMEQFEPNTDTDIKKYWQVMDRTESKNVDSWEYENGKVRIKEAVPYHQYTVAFLAWQLWEPVSMYNHITNNWTKEHKIPVDIRYPEAGEHLLKVLKQWLEDHTGTDVVRFTTFFYNFDLVYNEYGKESRVNWFGYASCVSLPAMEQFKEEYGYELTPEDFVDQGCYHTPFKNPDKRYLDWMEFNQKFVASFAKKCVDLVHSYGKKAIMFLGDHWAGTEPYGKFFKEIGLDAVVGAAGDGVTTRMIADIPVKETEARFYPYFFPDVFRKDGDPVGESKPIWKKCRRALLRKPMARMGYGGYLSLAYQFPDFISHVTDIAGQFKSIHRETEGTKADTAPFKVAVLNAWGNIRSWQTHQVAHSLWNQRCYSYLGVLEALAGLPFDIEFISFEDIKKNGIPENTGVIMNAGDGGTSWSGGNYWGDMEVVTSIRRFVKEGGGFIGIGEPAAYLRQGKYFQLEDVLGIQKEIGFTASNNKTKALKTEHFITEDCDGPIDYGEGMTMIYPVSDVTKVLDILNGSCNLAVNAYGEGRSVYIAGMPYNDVNARIILRAIYWAAGKEQSMYRWFSSNIHTECSGFPEAGRICLVNNSEEVQHTKVFLDHGETRDYRLQPMEMLWDRL